MNANHAGGYSYRLCKMNHAGIQHLTEECFQVCFSFRVVFFTKIRKTFQEMPLNFAGEHQWVVYNEVILNETGAY